MNSALYIIVLLIFPSVLCAQITGPDQPAQEQGLEQLAEKEEMATEDDSDWQQAEEYRKHPLDLNTATEEELQSFPGLTALQIKNFLTYRQLLGKLIAIYELQAIPGWDIPAIKQILPYVTTGMQVTFREALGKRLKGGSNSLLIRTSQLLEKSRGFGKPADSAASHYLGSPQRILFRYTYRYKSLLQYGILGDKDPGEQFFRGAQRYGFDFYSWHFFLRQSGIIKSLAIGDFTVNMGQGLIQWQSLAFTKSTEVLMIKRQAPVLRAYHAAGEFNFHRGAGITLQKRHWEATVFLSLKKVSANRQEDTASREELISSFASSGYHRTASEIADKNNTRQFAAGGNIGYSRPQWHAGINIIHYDFSNPVQKQDQPYNLFAIQGKRWTNLSADYSYTYRNLHFFGEAAWDKNGHRALLNGLLLSLAPVADAALLYRNIEKQYQSLYADAFTENTAPTNEKGLYAGLSVRPFAGWKLNLFFDVYTFPWLKYRADAPGYGRDFMIQLYYQPSKEWNINIRFKNEARQANAPGSSDAMHQPVLIPRQDLRMQLSVKKDREIAVGSRIELLWYDKKAADAEQGFLGSFDLLYQPRSKPYSANIRLQYFETGGYNSRVYAFEQDLLYSFSLPALFDKGFRYYLNLHTKFNRLFHWKNIRHPAVEGWLRWAQTVYPGKTTMGTGLDEIKGNKTHEVKIQFMITW